MKQNISDSVFLKRCTFLQAVLLQTSYAERSDINAEARKEV